MHEIPVEIEKSPKYLDVPAATPTYEDIDREFYSLMEGVRNGSQEAAWKLIDLYGEHIRRWVRRRMHAHLKPKFDSVDFVQQVWLTFFTDRQRILDFSNSQALLSFLIKLANRKVDYESRRLRAGIRDASREQEMWDERAGKSDRIPRCWDTPSRVCVARERWQEMLSQLPQEYQQIVQMRFEGYHQHEIAEQLGIAQSTVSRVVRRVLGE